MSEVKALIARLEREGEAMQGAPCEEVRIALQTVANKAVDQERRWRARRDR